MPATENFYETDKAISEYLLFHYGAEEHFLLDGLGPREALGFPRRCAELARYHTGRRRRALDLGCAVGGSACALSAKFDEVVAIDFSHGLIDAAKRIAQGESLLAEVADEGEITKSISLRRPADTRPERLTLAQGDAMDLSPSLGQFDFILMANLIDRLPDPALCLNAIGKFASPGATLAITSPYTWLEEYTPRSKWLGGYMKVGQPVRSFETLASILAPEFEQIASENMPFLIREHARKNQYSIAHATVWRKR